MLAVEIVLIIVGTICICASFFVAKKKGTTEGDADAQVHGADLWTEKDEEVIIKHIDEILENRGMELVETTEDQMNRICNEKIMAIDEFSKPLMDKIHVNHEEVVFMYNMLGEKQKELQKLMEEDTVRRSVPNITPVGTVPEQEKLSDPVATQTEDEPTGLDQTRQKSQTIFAPHEKKENTIPEVSTGQPIRPVEMLGTSRGNEVGPHRTVFTAQQYTPAKKDPMYDLPEPEPPTSMLITPVQPVKKPEPPVDLTPPPVSANTVPFKPAPPVTPSGQKVTAIERLSPQKKPAATMKATIAAGEPDATAIPPQDQMKRPSREFVFQHMEETAGNGRGEDVEDRIRRLYKQGKSVVDISKELNIGQGEVKLMIAMYKKRA